MLQKLKAIIVLAIAIVVRDITVEDQGVHCCTLASILAALLSTSAVLSEWLARS
jgi:hypothetical protein